MHPFCAVLLVDDDRSTNFLNEATLYPLRLTDTYLTALDGREGLELLLRQESLATPAQPVLVLLDMAMPVLNGMGFLEEFSILPAALQAATVLVVLAESMMAADLGRIENFPVAGIIAKPLVAERLTTILQMHFNKHGLGPLPLPSAYS